MIVVLELRRLLVHQRWQRRFREPYQARSSGWVGGVEPELVGVAVVQTDMTSTIPPSRAVPMLAKLPLSLNV